MQLLLRVPGVEQGNHYHEFAFLARILTNHVEMIHIVRTPDSSPQYLASEIGSGYPGYISDLLLHIPELDKLAWSWLLQRGLIKEVIVPGDSTREILPETQDPPLYSNSLLEFRGRCTGGSQYRILVLQESLKLLRVKWVIEQDHRRDPYPTQGLVLSPEDLDKLMFAWLEYQGLLV